MESPTSAWVKVQTMALLFIVLIGVGAIVARGSDRHHSQTAQLLKLIHASTASVDHARTIRTALSVRATTQGHAAAFTDVVVTDRLTHDSTQILTSNGSSTRRIIGVKHVLYAEVSPARRFENAGKRWVATRVQPTVAAKQFSGSTGTEMLQMLAGADGSVARIGPKQVGTIATTGYAVTVNATALLGGVMHQIDPAVTDDQLNSLGFDKLPMKVYLDAHGFPREMTLTMNIRGVTVDEVAVSTPSAKPLVVHAPPAKRVHHVATLLDVTRLIS